MLQVEGEVREPDVGVRLTLAGTATAAQREEAERVVSAWWQGHRVHWVSDFEWTEATAAFHIDLGSQDPANAVAALADALAEFCDRHRLDAVLAFPQPPKPGTIDRVLLACDGAQWDIVVDGVGHWLAPADTPTPQVQVAAVAWLQARYGDLDVDWDEPRHPSAIVGRVTQHSAA